MEPAPRGDWLNSPEGKNWLIVTVMMADARSFTRFTIVMVLGALLMRMHGVSDRVTLFTFVMWVPVLTALKSISASKAKQSLLDYRKKMAQK